MPGIFYFGISVDFRTFSITDAGTNASLRYVSGKFMDIKDFNELNALNKLFSKIKFQDDLDFFEFKEFVASPFIADIFKRVNDEFWEEAIKRGHIKSGQKPVFEYEGHEGKTVRKRIDELTKGDCETLLGLGDKQIDEYLKVLIAPLQTTEKEFDLLRQYAFRKIKTSH